MKVSQADYNRLREIWRSMKKRTENPACKDYPHYGGRGIKVCDEWHDFETFCKWALTHGYGKDLTLDRISNSKGYSPGNCRWISRKGQAVNRSTNTYIQVRGKNKTISQWSEVSGIPEDRIIRRMQNGWSAERAVETPLRRYNKGED